MHYGLVAGEWGDRTHAPGKLTLVGNLLELGPDSASSMTFMHVGSSDPLELFMEDNGAFNRDGKPVPLSAGRFTRVEQRPLWPDGLVPLPGSKVKETVAREVGARPWDRDPIDARIIRAALDGKGHIIDSQQEVGGYPQRPASSAPFDPAQWDLQTLVRK
jgi:hypothetical protein